MTIEKIISSFRKNLASAKIQNEVACFQSLSKAIAKHTNCYSKEFHGTRFLVTFDAKRPYPHRTVARCELCDVLYIVFSNKEIRIAFIQAKREYSSLKLGCKHEFKTSLEQWELLHWQRQVKSANKNIFIPKNILKSTYRSITSFIFFHPIKNSYDLIYCSASSLWQKNKHFTGVQGKVLFHLSPTGHLNESLHECNISDFLLKLLDGKIGSSVLNQNGQAHIAYINSLLNFLIEQKNENDLNAELLYELKKIVSSFSEKFNIEKSSDKPHLPKIINIIKKEDSK